MEKLFRLLFGLFMLTNLSISAQKVIVPANVYSSNRSYIGRGTVEFNYIPQNQYFSIIAEANGQGDVASFSAMERGTVSTSNVQAGYRWWFTGAYTINGQVRDYNIVILDPCAEGYRVFFKRTNTLSGKVPPSERAYVISDESFRNVLRDFIIPATKCLKVAEQGDLWGDHLNINKQAINK